MEIINSKQSDCEFIIKTLCKSFNDDPVVNWFIRQDLYRDDAIREFFEKSLLVMALPYKKVHHITEYEGVVLPVPSESWAIGLFKQLRFFSSICRVSGIKQLPKVINGLYQMNKVHITRPHMYLLFIGVNPNAQGKGVGSNLLSNMIEECDQQGLPIYLENSNPDNELFYQRFGFVIIHEIKLGRNAPRLTAMVREPNNRKIMNVSSGL
ncbi:MAG: GNAT family N-acetyltransferase [Gammaproteobacteria bacterium]|nr:GNAT family N-acetyltransferase [Gammaproteobacteria bacterium]